MSMDRYIFKTTDSNLKHRNGQKVAIVRTITDPEEGFDAECLPMEQVRFGDGYVTECWPDELTKLVPPRHPYRDLI